MNLKGMSFIFQPGCDLKGNGIRLPFLMDPSLEGMSNFSVEVYRGNGLPVRPDRIVRVSEIVKGSGRDEYIVRTSTGSTTVKVGTPWVYRV